MLTIKCFTKFWKTLNAKVKRICLTVKFINLIIKFGLKSYSYSIIIFLNHNWIPDFNMDFFLLFGFLIGVLLDCSYTQIVSFRFFHERNLFFLLEGLFFLRTGSLFLLTCRSFFRQTRGWKKEKKSVLNIFGSRLLCRFYEIYIRN